MERKQDEVLRIVRSMQDQLGLGEPEEPCCPLGHEGCGVVLEAFRAAASAHDQLGSILTDVALSAQATAELLRGHRDRAGVAAEVGRHSRMSLPLPRRAAVDALEAGGLDRMARLREDAQRIRDAAERLGSTCSFARDSLELLGSAIQEYRGDFPYEQCRPGRVRGE